MATNNDHDKANPEVGQPAVPTVDWDDSQMQSSFANVVNASSTREEVSLFFGTNETWKPTADRTFKVRLKDRIVLNPHAAKRLWILLGAIIKEYESRFGTINMSDVQSSNQSAVDKAQTAKDAGATTQ